MASSDLLLLHADDNVLVARRPIAAGTTVQLEAGPVPVAGALALGHKLARRPIAEGQAILKYGMPIGFATCPIAAGQHVHLHNVRSGYTASVELNDA